MNNSTKNVLSSIVSNIVTIIVGLIAQALFIKLLGTVYLGLNGLFSNILSLLSIVELGIGSAIIYNLYKPLKSNNVKEIKALMNYYKKAYNVITIIVLVLGILLIPFLKYIVNIKSVTVDINIYLVYIIFLIDTVCSYILSYKRSILYASERNYIISITHIFYTIIMNALQILLLYLTQNYYLYLVMKVIMRLLENVVLTRIVDHNYPYLIKADKTELSKKVREDINKKVKALFFHKIGGFVINGTDNIIISYMLGIITVGLYSNYYLIINAVLIVFSQAITALTPSVGNMLLKNDSDKSYDIFKKIRFLNFYLACFASVSVFIIMESFISIWLGKSFILSTLVLAVLTFNLYQKLMRSSYQTYKDAAGIFYEDRFIPIVESVTNIIFSIVLCKIFGLAGIFMGTIVSGLALWLYSYPKFIYKNIFKRRYLDYAMETLGYILVFVIVITVTYIFSVNLTFNNDYLEFTKNMIFSLTIPNILLIIIFYRSSNFRFYLDEIYNKLNQYKYNNNKTDILFTIFMMMLSVLMFIFIYRINLLPIKFIILSGIGILILNLIIIGLFLYKNKILTLISYFMYLLLIIIYIITFILGININKNFDKLFNNYRYEVSNYYIITLNNNDVNGFTDLNNQNIGYFEDYNNNKLLKEINKNVSANYLLNNDLNELYNKLIIKDYRAIIMLDDYYNTLIDENEEVLTNTKIIHTIKLKEIINKSKEVKDLTPINIYLSGSDSRSNNIINNSRSDVNMVITINPNTNTILMTSIPRDYYVDIYNHGPVKDKLTHAGNYGLETSTKTIENLLDIKIDYSIKVNFNGLISIIDDIGGVDVFSDREFTSSHIKDWKVKSGWNHMNSLQALAYARERYAYPEGDRHRILNQQQVLEAVLKKIFNSKSLLKNYETILKHADNLYLTNIPSSYINLLARKQLSDMNSWNFLSYRVSGSDAYLETNTSKNSKRYVMIPYDNQVKLAKTKIDEVKS